MQSDAQPSTTDFRKTPAEQLAAAARSRSVRTTYRLQQPQRPYRESVPRLSVRSRAQRRDGGCVHERRKEKKSPPGQETLKSRKQTAEGNKGAKRNSEEREGEPDQQCRDRHEQGAGDDSRHHDHLR